MRFGILGPVEIRRAGTSLRLPRAQNRGLLGYLLLSANQVVALDSLIDALWGGAEPATARSQVHSSIHAIRRQLREAGDQAELAGTAGGYVLRVAAGQLDVLEFQRHVTEARAARAGGDHTAARSLLRDGLALWRGPALADATGAFVEAARARLGDQRLTATEDLIDAELALGRPSDVIGEFGPLVDQHPLRERLRGQIMLALYRSGRQVDALASYQDLRGRLADEQGLDPGQPLRDLERAILRSDPALDLPAPPRPAQPAPPPAPEPAVEPEPEPAVEPEPDTTTGDTLPVPVRQPPPHLENLPAPRPGTALPVVLLRPLDAPPDLPPDADPAIPGRAGHWTSRRRLLPPTLIAALIAAAVGAVLLRDQLGLQSTAEDPFQPENAVTVAITNEGPPGTEEDRRVLEVADYQVRDDAPLHLWSWRPESENVRHQIWVVEKGEQNRGGVSTSRFRNVNSDKCLDRGHGGSATDVFQVQCSESSSQQWYFDEAGRLRNAADGDCLDIAGARWEDGSPIRMAPCGGGWSQQWFPDPRRDWS